jgi:hypothetical protein
LSLFSCQDFAYDIILAFLERRTIHGHLARTVQKFREGQSAMVDHLKHNLHHPLNG